MVQINIEVEVEPTSLSNLQKLVNKLVLDKFRKNFIKLDQIVEESVKNTITANSNKFIPDDSQAAELGVGQDGAIDRDKIFGAWRQLLPGAGFTDISVRRIGGGSTNNIGVIIVSMDTEGFLSAPFSIVSTPDSDKIDEIRWMDWFLFGKTITGVRFSNRQPISETSRTGRGIMIDGGLWMFPMTQPSDFFARLLDDMLDIINIAVITTKGIKRLKE